MNTPQLATQIASAVNIHGTFGKTIHFFELHNGGVVKQLNAISAFDDDIVTKFMKNLEMLKSAPEGAVVMEVFHDQWAGLKPKVSIVEWVKNDADTWLVCSNMD